MALRSLLTLLESDQFQDAVHFSESPYTWKSKQTPDIFLNQSLHHLRTRWEMETARVSHDHCISSSESMSDYRSWPAHIFTSFSPHARRCVRSLFVRIRPFVLPCLRTSSAVIKVCWWKTFRVNSDLTHSRFGSRPQDHTTGAAFHSRGRNRSSVWTERKLMELDIYTHAVSQ